MSIFSDALAKTKLPEQALEPIEKALVEAFSLTVENNKRVAQVNATRAQNPGKPGYEDYLDKLIQTHAPTDERVREDLAKFDEISEEYERLNKKLRDHAKANYIPEELSEEAARKTRQLVNESVPAIQKAREAAQNMAAIVDQMLSLHGAAIEGGVISLIPELDSLKNARGRKAATASSGGPYMTRVAEILLDGKSTNKEINGESKGKLNYAADALSKAFNAEKFPANRVTPEELEVAYLKEFGYDSREESKADDDSKLADKEFVFEKEVEVQNPNDDSTTKVPRKVKVLVKRTAKVEPEKTETAQPETPNAEGEAVKPETVSAPANVPTNPAPAKKTAAPAKKA